MSRLTELQDRIDILEGSVTSNLDAIAREIRVLREVEQAQQETTLGARLDPGPLDGRDVGVPGRTPTDLGAPLSERLRNDPSLGVSVGGSMHSAVQSGNLLIDPTFESVTAVVYDITTAWAPIGAFWEARYTLNSGDAPVTLTLGLATGRVSTQLWSSGLLELLATWTTAVAADITVELRPAIAAKTGYIDWPYLVAATRVVPRTVTSFDTANVYQDILDVSGTPVIVDSSDEVELSEVLAINAEARPHAAYELPSFSVATDVARYQLRFELVKTTAATDTSLAVRIAEPMANLSDEDTPLTYAPAVGSWNPIPVYRGVRIARTGTLVIGNANFAELTWPTADIDVEIDTDGYHDGGTETQRFTAPHRGVYSASCTVALEADSTGVRILRLIRSLKSGSWRVHAQHKTNAPSGGLWFGTVNEDVFLEEGGWVHFELYQNSGGNLNLEGESASDRVAASLRLIAWQP